MFTDYAFDLETLSTTSNAAILSIGAVAFDRNASKFQPSELFYTNVRLQDCLNLNMTVDAGTFHWWMEQDPKARYALLNPPPAPLHDALMEFKGWVSSLCELDHCAWSHATFDPPILNNAFVKTRIQPPTSFRHQRDLRTLVDLRGPYEKDFGGINHKADHDALWEAEMAWHLLTQ